MIKIRTESVSLSYGKHVVLRDVTVFFRENELTAIVGPSGVGKSSLLMLVNRLWESVPGASVEGKVEVKFNGLFHDINRDEYPLTALRRSVGMVFQKPNPLPMSVHRNVAFPLKLSGHRDKKVIDEKVESALKRAYLWDEVKDRLGEDAFHLSGGQQQRLCIARALILEPEILLLDEPTSSLDADAGAVIEELLIQLKQTCTLLVVSHYLDQVNRIADSTYVLKQGQLFPIVKSPEQGVS